eukprot:CAMPEP_0114552234 /NCGR_PEP_ID=MMETSP0114-20121206/7018_1 /TAXON_ID=31324 /ORGANISM="Goniomonas sp, Strain m" /LENGTH=462 /DNA_ID=CAMNT_0001737101 /DNA_START=20 /DNA_END=1408 /DNA_ORIENTATION=+
MAAANFASVEEKMVAGGCSPAAIAAFRSAYDALASGKTGFIPESDITPVKTLPRYEELSEPADADNDGKLLASTVVLKLNGGLGTSMGLEQAKSLLKIKDEMNFLDVICKQIDHTRAKFGPGVKFMLMNSFSTSDDTLAHIGAERAKEGVELLQNKVPKIDASTMQPATCAKDPELEWCPPGHGDLYAALLGSGKLDELLAGGYEYMFVSNSDNLGATLDLKLLRHFALSGKPFLMEVAERTEADKKGGHLAAWASNGKLLLRETAQCQKQDEGEFQNVAKHRFFNTNNLWINLKALKAVLDKSGGFMPLPLIKNSKTVDPRDSKSTPVFQLETAMGAAIEAFDGAGAVVIPRDRFAPVKTCNDLVVLRSDCYKVNDDFTVDATVRPTPIVDLDPARYKLVDSLDSIFPNGVPSLKGCSKLTVRGEVVMAAGVVFTGECTVTNGGAGPKTLASGTYSGAVNL